MFDDDDDGDSGSFFDGFSEDGDDDEDFADDDEAVDEGDWSDVDYEESAEELFGDSDYFGESIVDQLEDEGYQHYNDPAFYQVFESIAPGTSETVQLFERGGTLSAFGFVPLAVLEALLLRYPGIDFWNVHTTVPDLGGRVEPRPLPPELSRLQEAPSVDLRRFASPVGDQRHTSRCSAFAWTHAQEIAQRIVRGDPTRLSPNFTMLGIQEMQGDARDFRYAFKGGQGAIGGPEPGHVLRNRGTCRQDLWPDDSATPVTEERALYEDAAHRRLPALPYPIALDDVRKVLTAGMPVQVSMTTGREFAQIGRDGLFHAAESAWGDHGRHAMLIAGYTGNYFIVKNSWGDKWGDQGYCYIPRKVLAESDADLVAVLIGR